MDWNWFFGALSQSAAAIVGIFGAFVITKIFGNQSEFSQKLHSSREALAKSERIIDGISDLSIDWYNKRTTENELHSLEELLEEDAKGTPQDYYEKLNFSPFLASDEAKSLIQDKLSHKLAAEKLAHKRAKEKAATRKSNQAVFGAATAHFLSMDTSSNYMRRAAPNLHSYPAINKERDAIDELVREAKHQVRTNSDRLESIRGNPESSPQITYVLFLITILFCAGVIYPLSFLPVPADGNVHLSLSAFWDILFSLKGALLAITSLVFTSILFLFFWLNFKLKYPKDVFDKLERHTDLGSFSSYFSIMKKNSVRSPVGGG